MKDSEISCELCNNTGWIVDENNNATPCKCYKERIKSNKIKFANIPDAFKDIRLRSFNTGFYKDKDGISEVVNTIKYYLNTINDQIEEGIGLYMYSETKGSGKTRMATSLANELIYEHEMNVRFVTSLDIISEIRATWDKDTEFQSESRLMNYLKSVEVLVIDDFGTEVYKEWLDDKFYQIINARYINKLITIYTSNFRLDQLKYDERIKNRIKEKVYQIHFPEESLRDGISAIREIKLKEAIGGAK